MYVSRREANMERGGFWGAQQVAWSRRQEDALPHSEPGNEMVYVKRGKQNKTILFFRTYVLVWSCVMRGVDVITGEIVVRWVSEVR